jgi:hypothetical protein
MNTKALVYLGSLLSLTLAAPIVNAGPHRGGGNRVAPMRGGGMARPFVGGNRIGAWNGAHWNNWNGNHWNGAHWNNWNGNHWNGAHWNNWNWHHHHHDHFNDVTFIGGFGGFPFWGWGWGWGYPYGYYGSYPYGYYGNGYYGGGGYYGSGYYGNSGYGYNNGYSNGYGSSSSVTELQRKLADGGYYHGPIDGIMGSRTQHALRAYQYDRRNGNIGGSSPTLRSRPYSPPPITTEPQEPSE